MNGSEDRKDVNTVALALMQLIEKLSENNNISSGTMRVMSENLSECSDAISRVEEKVDLTSVMMEEHCKLWNQSHKSITEFINKFKDSGFVEFLFKFKKIWKIVITAFIGSLGISAAIWIYKAFMFFQNLLDKTGG